MSEKEEFEKWWFSTQFDRGYWRQNKAEHRLEYNWAFLGWKAALKKQKRLDHF